MGKKSLWMRLSQLKYLLDSTGKSKKVSNALQYLQPKSDMA